jgi:hypothetical protein
VLWAIVDCAVLLQISRGKQVREERQRKRREIGERRQQAAHRRERIPFGKPADWRSSDERFRRDAMELVREEKGEMREACWATYSHGHLAEQARVCAGEGDGRPGRR